MPVLFEEIIKKDLSVGNFAPVYILFGNDSYLKKLYFDKLCDSTYGGDPFFNLLKFDRDLELQDVYDAVMQYPMMSDTKCVAITDFDIEGASKDDFDKFCAIINEVTDGTTLVIRFDAEDFDFKKSSRAKKLMTTAEKLGGKVIALNRRTLPQLAKTLTETAKKRGCTLSDKNARYLIETAGDDLATLKNEIDKLCAFADSGEITKETIDFVSIKTSDASVYDYVKEVLSGKVSTALKMLSTMFYSRMEPMIILYTIASTYVDIYRVYTARKEGLNNGAVADKFGYKNKAFVLDRASAHLKNMDAKKLALSFKVLLDTDKALKSFGSDAAIILEQMTVKLSCIAVKGESID